MLEDPNVSKFLFFIIFILSPTLNEGRLNRFVVWNVGQGLTTTLVTSSACLHFDMGGEISPLINIYTVCRHLKNRVYFSHWDWDHIGFSKMAFQKLPSLCVAKLPGGLPSRSKEALMSRFPLCTGADLNLIQELTNPKLLATAKNSNNASRVLTAFSKIILPGDSTNSQEKIWSARLPLYMTSAVLVLGHHGSKTSTSETLLNRLHHVRMAIASARKNRYGHPHQETLLRLKLHKVPTLSTENWGSISLEL